MNMSKKILIIIILGLLFIPSITAFADEEIIATDCYCYYDKDKNNLDCSSCNTGIEEALLNKCGGRDAELTKEIKFFCSPATGLQSLFTIDTDRVKPTALESCQYHLMNTTKTYETGNIKVAAFSYCIAPSQILGDNICEEQDVIKAFTFIGYLLFFAKLLVPFIIILIGTLDYYKAITGEKDDSLKIQTQKFLRRIVIGFIIFFIPTIINTFLTFLGNYSNTISTFEQCTECLLDPISCK